MRILLTGANGFVGRVAADRLERDGECCVRRAIRQQRGERSDSIAIGSIGPETDWKRALSDVDVVVHTAARVHMMADSAADPIAEFRKVNTEGTLQLAHQAAQAGVRRFVFISSVKVNGEDTQPGRPFRADDPVKMPEDPYGISKYEAENGLRRLAEASGMELVIIRPVLVYGPGVRANFLSMMRWLSRGIPLPLGAIVDNRRSLLAVDNLADLIAACVTHPNAAGQVFLAADGEDVSTTDLLRKMAAALGVPARLVPVPVGLLKAVTRLAGKEGIAQRLCGSLQVDISKAVDLLEWRPPMSMDVALRETARAFHEARS